MGRTKHGKVNTPTTIFDYGSFVRLFGDLAADYPLSYAVRDFFLNGGGQAIIVRLFRGDPPSAADAGASKQVQAVAVSAATALFTAATNEAKKANSTTGTVLKAVQEEASKQTSDLTLILEVNKQRQALRAAEDTLAPQAQATALALAHVRAAEATAQSLMQFIITNADSALTPQLTTALTAANETVDKQKAALSESTNQQSDSIKKVQDARAALTTATQKLAAPQTIATAVQALVKAKVAPGADGKLDISWLPKTDDANAIATFVTQALSKAGPASTATEPDPESDSGPLDLDPAAYQRGLTALKRVDLFNLLCIPPDKPDEQIADYSLRTSVYQDALSFCVARRAMLIVDPPPAWRDVDDLVSDPQAKLNELNLSGTLARNAAIFYPRVRQVDPISGAVDSFAPCGIVAGVMARTDATRGVWKAPAGIDASLNGIIGLEVSLTDDENGVLNQLGINCLRSFPVYGRVVWGERTLRGANEIGDEYKHIPVRRTALFIEESLFRGLKWVVFEPNDEPLWAQIRLNVGAFMHNLFRQGAFQGTTPRDAYFVKCDKETTTQNDINEGKVNIMVGFAPLKPAEFVFIKLQQITGQIEV
nr:phage tail sheath C-terminal domain-containing protein [Candidatus Chloroploca mongolica]